VIYGDTSKHLIHVLENSEYEFYLTGSRYFGTSNPLSDWDFFAEETPQMKKFLIDLGFLPDHAAHDERVLRNHYGLYQSDIQPNILIYGLHQVHIQLVTEKYLEEKLEAQKFLLEQGIIKEIWEKTDGTMERKKKNHAAWDMAVLFVRRLHEPKPDQISSTGPKSKIHAGRKIQWSSES